jgi:flagellar basal-body rod protein FlgC
MYGALDISTSALVAQRTRLNVISANLANRDTILNADGEYEPYRRRFAVLAAAEAGSAGERGGLGVRVAGIEIDDSPLQARLEPDSPYADARGMVHYPNVSPVIEQMDAMEATRSYEASISAIEATKSMIGVALEILA